ncbi:Plant self-incompatibility S1 [Arabidopsis suecica]|uniref:S-protein homolog n=1 Tax=Arabidopsis suecica TaxID=45249 RepID=A0A8T1YN12_ARASU|nr:Plant self-incompatibility S1 [Arabidopsis suecica]
MNIPKQYLPIFILIIFITTKLSQADQNNNSPVPNDPSSTNSLFPGGKITVEIINDLGNQLTLLYHCKSKDDDLGNRSLQSGESWSFRFGRQFFGRTLYFCNFDWPNESHSFDIYKDHRDSSGDTWCEKCVWKIRKTGPCRFSDVTKQFDICYPWNKSLY